MADLLGLPIPQKRKRSTRARPREKTPAPGAQARAPAALRRCVSRGEASFLYCLSPSTETVPAADAVQPSARTPPTRAEEAAAGQALLVLPVAHRTRNSPLLLAAAAHTEGDGLALALPNAVQTIMVTVNLRTAEQLERKRGDGFRLHPGCPQGPWQAHDEAKRAVKLWAMSKQDGSWGVTWVKGEDPGNSRRGPQRFLACAQHTRFRRCGGTRGRRDAPVPPTSWGAQPAAAPCGRASACACWWSGCQARARQPAPRRAGGRPGRAAGGRAGGGAVSGKACAEADQVVLGGSQVDIRNTL